MRVLLSVVLLAALPLAGGLSTASASEDPVGVGISVGVVVPTGGPQPDWVATVPFGDSAPQAEVSLTIKNLQPQSPIQAFLHSTPVLFATGTADETGTVILSGRLPQGMASGEHTITVNAIGRNGLAFSSTVLSFIVTADGILQALTPATAFGSKTAAAAATVGLGSIASVTQTVVVEPAGVTAALGADAFNLGGVLTVSGVTAHPAFSAAPGGGETVLELTLKNVSAYAVNSSLRFWLQNALGATIAEVSNIAVTEQASGETRTVAVIMSDIGQYGVYNAFVTLTPPESVGGTSLTPLTRDAPMFVLPIFLLLVLVVVGGSFFGIRSELRRRRRGSDAVAEEAEEAEEADDALEFGADEVVQEVLA
jgi:hypothetical protein